MNESERRRETPHLSVVVPAFNEENTILSTLEAIEAWLRERASSFEILLIDDGSEDRTHELARRFAETRPECRPLRNDRNRGKGYAVRRGIEESNGEYVLFSDADLSTPIGEAEKLLAALEAGGDVAIGSRDLPGSDVRLHQPWYRETMGRIFNRIVRILVLRGFADTQCGFKAFRRASIAPLLPLLRVDRYSFDVEILYVARLFRLQIREVPVVWINSPDTRVDALRDSFRMLIDLLRIRYYHVAGRYGMRGTGAASARSKGERPAREPRDGRE